MRELTDSFRRKFWHLSSALLLTASLAVADESRPGLGSAGSFAAWLDAEIDSGRSEPGADVDLCDDVTFLRRVYLDLVGRIPSVSEARDFLDEPRAGKRALLVDALLIDPKDDRKTSRSRYGAKRPKG